MDIRVTTNVEGLDATVRKLEGLETQLQAIDGQHQIPLANLLTPEFIQRHTDYSSLDQWIDAGGLKIKSADDFKNIPTDQWDAFVGKSTKFPDWNTMLQAATKEWLTKRIGL